MSRIAGELPSARNPAAAGMLLRPLLFAAMCCVAAFAIWRATFVGFLASDDWSYLAAAEMWLDHAPYIGTTHWSLRLTVVLPMVLFVRLFGSNEHSIVISSLLYEIGTVITSGLFLGRMVSARAALVTSSLLLTLPLFAIATTMAEPDLVELFYVSLSVWLFVAALERAGAPLYLLGSGAAAGLAIVTRETSIGLLLAYGVLFLAGFGMPRGRYWIMAGGFALIEGGETLFYWIAAGDPLHRLEVMRAIYSQDTSVPVPTSGIGIDRSGALRITPVLDPIIMLFTRIDYGLVFFAGVPAAVAAIRNRRIPSRAATIATVMLVVASAWFVFNGIALNTVGLLPRYYCVSTFAMIVVIGLWLAGNFASGAPRHGAGVLALLVGVNLAGLYLEDKDPLFGPKALVGYLVSHPGTTVNVDPELALRSAQLVEWAGISSSRVTTAPPQAGDLEFFDPFTYGRQWETQFVAERPLFEPKPNWQVVWRGQEDRKYIGVVLEWLGLDRWLPRYLYTRLNQPRPAVALYRVVPPNG